MNETSMFDAQEINTMCGVLATKDTVWGDRINALEHLREMATAATEGSAHTYDAATLAHGDRIVRIRSELDAPPLPRPSRSTRNALACTPGTEPR